MNQITAVTRQPTVLWISQGDGGHQDLKQFIKSQFSECEFPADAQVGRNILKNNNNIDVIIADDSLGPQGVLDFLNFAKLHAPTATRLAFSNPNNQLNIDGLVNEAGVFRLLPSQIDEKRFARVIETAADNCRKLKSQAKILHEISFQNKKLEELTHNLEFIVEERTRSIENSREQDAHQLKIMRGLLGFIKNLSLANIVDDWLGVIGNEVRKIHGLSSPVLAFISPGGTRRLVTFRGKDLVEIETDKPWPEVADVRAGVKEDQHYLANIFSRPFANVVSVPLGKERTIGVLYFEYLFSGTSLASFLDFIYQRVQPILLSLDRILLEQQTRFASKQWEQTFDSLHDSVAIIDLEYKLIRANKSFANLRAQGTCHKIFAGSDEVCMGCPVSQAMKSNQPEVSRVRVKDKIFEVHSYPIEGTSGGGVTNVINHYVDITEERKLFARLVQNEKMVAVGALAANIAHELNNPLTGIRSLAQFLKQTVEKEKYKQLVSDLAEIESASERSQKTIKNLLEFSQPFEVGNVSVVPLDEIIKKTLPLLKSAMRDHRNFIELSEQNIPIKVDVQLIQQVVFNLVLNACQAMKNPGEIRIETRLVQADGKTFGELSVEDTGHGISAENIKQIFEPFFTTKGDEQGTGIGLSLSKNIVERFGGRILVESEKDKGTKFFVRLPVVKD